VNRKRKSNKTNQRSRSKNVVIKRKDHQWYALTVIKFVVN
jgi:hypothetical protein